jgi:hypothetical protein
MDDELKKEFVKVLWAESNYHEDEVAQDIRFLATSVKNNMEVFGLMLKLRNVGRGQPHTFLLDAVEATFKKDDERAKSLIKKWKEMRKYGN